MTKSELIEVLARKQKHLPTKDVELAVKHLPEGLSVSDGIRQALKSLAKA